jgi:hypothetical protein
MRGQQPDVQTLWVVEVVGGWVLTRRETEVVGIKGHGRDGIFTQRVANPSADGGLSRPRCTTHTNNDRLPVNRGAEL